MVTSGVFTERVFCSFYIQKRKEELPYKLNPMSFSEAQASTLLGRKQPMELHMYPGQAVNLPGTLLKGAFSEDSVIGKTIISNPSINGRKGKSDSIVKPGKYVGLLIHFPWGRYEGPDTSCVGATDRKS